MAARTASSTRGSACRSRARWGAPSSATVGSGCCARRFDYGERICPPVLTWWRSHVPVSSRNLTNSSSGCRRWPRVWAEKCDERRHEENLAGAGMALANAGSPARGVVDWYGASLPMDAQPAHRKAMPFHTDLQQLLHRGGAKVRCGPRGASRTVAHLPLPSVSPWRP